MMNLKFKQGILAGIVRHGKRACAEAFRGVCFLRKREKTCPRRHYRLRI